MNFERYIPYYVFLPVRVAERDVIELDFARFFGFFIFRRINYVRFRLENLIDTPCRNLRSREKNEHHHKHHERHDYLRRKHHERRNRCVIGRSLVDKACAYPINSERNAVHDESHYGTHKPHNSAREKLHATEISVYVFEFVFDVILGVVCFNYSYTRKVFAGYAVKIVGQLLSLFEYGQNRRHYTRDRHY